jgi:hypothetical protein
VRHVDLTRLIVPVAWEKKADRLRAKAKSDHDAGRRPAFNAEWWRDEDIRNALIALSSSKCWYCETLIDGNNPDVDHWRPKASVRGIPAHPGYWWLAYEPSNFRISCKFCNSNSQRGQDGAPRPTKMDHFPLLDEAARVFDSESSCQGEQPLLLDPTQVADCSLLGFTANGLVARHPYAPIVPADSCRPTRTIDILDLNRTGLRERRSQTIGKVARLVELLGSEAVPSFGVELISEMIAQSAAHSQAALAALRAHQHQPRVAAVFGRLLEDQVSYLLLPEVEADVAADTADPLAAESSGAVGATSRVRLLVGVSQFGEETAELYEDGRCRWGARTYQSLDTMTVAITGYNTDPYAFWKEVVDGMLRGLDPDK